MGKRVIRRKPLQFKCTHCEHVFVSNEYRNPVPAKGLLGDATAVETCQKCGAVLEGGKLYRPIMGTDEFKKWSIYEDK